MVPMPQVDFLHRMIGVHGSPYKHRAIIIYNQLPMDIYGRMMDFWIETGPELYENIPTQRDLVTSIRAFMQYMKDLVALNGVCKEWKRMFEEKEILYHGMRFFVERYFSTITCDFLVFACPVTFFDEMKESNIWYHLEHSHNAKPMKKPGSHQSVTENIKIRIQIFLQYIHDLKINLPMSNTSLQTSLMSSDLLTGNDELSNPHMLDDCCRNC